MLDSLAGYHAQYARASTEDLSTAERRNAIWKLSGETLAHAKALVALLEGGFTGQTWPVMRSIHEATRLLVAVTDPHEETIQRRWLADQQVDQAKARAAEQRQTKRIAEEMRAAGAESPDEDIEHFTQQIYR